MRFSTEALLTVDSNSGRAENLIGVLMRGSVRQAVEPQILVAELQPSVQRAYLVDEISQVRRSVPLYESNESSYAVKLVVTEAGVSETGFVAEASGSHELRWLSRSRRNLHPQPADRESMVIRDE